jgi:hypothetical protein
MAFFFAEIAVIAVRPFVLLMGICKRLAASIGFELGGSDYCYGDDVRGETVVLTSRFTRKLVMSGHAINIKTLSKPDCFFLFGVVNSGVIMKFRVGTVVRISKPQ